MKSAALGKYDSNMLGKLQCQSIGDLWSPIHPKKGIVFFKGEGFRLAAEMAEMSLWISSGFC
ncbi:MAG TPA: hypothetical protein VMU21_11765 [Thermodesulfovibrionales bacterium]|nr:hypothetical protein [Thermodesulfovibrionales bacterium]